MRIVDDISKFIFIEDIPKYSDVIFILGASEYKLAEKAAELFKDNMSGYIVPIGKYCSKRDKFPSEKTVGTPYEGIYETESVFLKDVLIKKGIPEENIFCESESRNTYENAFYSKELLNKFGIEVKTAIICCQAYHSRRVLMTYTWAFPNTKFYVCPVETKGINRENWHKTDLGIEKVLGELKRCGMYFEDFIKNLK